MFPTDVLNAQWHCVIPCYTYSWMWKWGLLGAKLFWPAFENNLKQRKRPDFVLGRGKFWKCFWNLIFFCLRKWNVAQNCVSCSEIIYFREGGFHRCTNRQTDQCSRPKWKLSKQEMKKQSKTKQKYPDSFGGAMVRFSWGSDFPNRPSCTFFCFVFSQSLDFKWREEWWRSSSWDGQESCVPFTSVLISLGTLSMSVRNASELQKYMFLLLRPEEEQWWCLFVGICFIAVVKTKTCAHTVKERQICLGWSMNWEENTDVQVGPALFEYG